MKKFLIALLLIFTIVGQPIATYASDNAFVNIGIGSNGKVSLKDAKDKEATVGHIIEKYKELITAFSGLAAITMVGIFIKHFVELGAKSTNPHDRAEITSGLLWSGLAAAFLGSVTFIVGVCYGVFK